MQIGNRKLAEAFLLLFFKFILCTCFAEYISPYKTCINGISYQVCRTRRCV